MWRTRVYEINEIPDDTKRWMAERQRINDGRGNVYADTTRIIREWVPCGEIEVYTDDKEGNDFTIVRQNTLERAIDCRSDAERLNFLGLKDEAAKRLRDAGACDRILELSGGTPERRESHLDPRIFM
ncbi:MAG: hypothetical protein J4432_01965 [DPANN group archaeon]|nr:hypothetical protein [DPANN group archaeon]